MESDRCHVITGVAEQPQSQATVSGLGMRLATELLDYNVQLTSFASTAAAAPSEVGLHCSFCADVERKEL